MTTPGNTVLIVDDLPLHQRLAGSYFDKLEGWTLTYASNGVEALQMLKEKPANLVLTDLIMPEMDGLELTQAIRTQYPMIPVILMTDHGSEEVAIRALQAGAASYVPKKHLQSHLIETVEQVMTVAQSKTNAQRILETIDCVETEFVLENDIGLVAPLVAHLEESLARMKLCEPGGLILIGVALHEAITNAIFHGNLELKSSLKEESEKAYYDLASKRRNEDPYAPRRVWVTATMTRHSATFTVRDEGPGFDPGLLPDPTDPKNLAKVSGRGLLLIQTFMDRVEHNAVGNQITMVKNRTHARTEPATSTEMGSS
jgi:CheY-like chemotaxis protein/anti-sigma regulatory factor (Ser/Thr protein kinase)